MDNESDNGNGPSIVYEIITQTTKDNRNPNSNRNSRKAKNRRQRRARSSVFNSANKDNDRPLSLCEKSEVQIEVTNTAEASPSSTIAPTVNSKVSTDNTAAASQSSEVATISSVKRKCNENVNKVSSTNDLPLKIDGKEKAEVQISEEIIDVAKSISDNGIDIIISGLKTRGDMYESKRKKVNFLLQDLCSQNGFAFVEHSNIHTNKHLNRSQIHVKQHVANILGNNLLCALRI